MYTFCYIILLINCFSTLEISFSTYFLKLINTCFALIGIWGYNKRKFCSKQFFLYTLLDHFLCSRYSIFNDITGTTNILILKSYILKHIQKKFFSYSLCCLSCEGAIGAPTFVASKSYVEAPTTVASYQQVSIEIRFLGFLRFQCSYS